jgi:hypothetical protein
VRTIPGQYAKLPLALAADADVPASAKLLWALLAHGEPQGGGWTYRRQASLAAAAGLSLRTCGEQLQALEAAGWLHVRGAAGAAKEYRVVAPGEGAPEADPRGRLERAWLARCDAAPSDSQRRRFRQAVDEALGAGATYPLVAHGLASEGPSPPWAGPNHARRLASDALGRLADLLGDRPRDLDEARAIVAAAQDAARRRFENFGPDALDRARDALRWGKVYRRILARAITWPNGEGEQT